MKTETKKGRIKDTQENRVDFIPWMKGKLTNEQLTNRFKLQPSYL